MDVTAVDALELLKDIADKNPSLIHNPSRRGYVRGIEFYSARAFLRALSTGLEQFARAHGRLPNLVAPQACVDHFFCLKFFGYIPMPPNPGDKLKGLEFVSKEKAASVTKPKVVWVSERPILPKNDELPEGNYYLKASNGSSMHARIKWPIDSSLRHPLEQKCEKWLQRKYGLRWGEWWYSTSKQQMFMEEDVSDRTISEVSYKIFVRRGRVKLVRAVNDPQKLERIFDAELDFISGQTEDFTPFDQPLPDNIDAMMSVAADIGRRFDVVRVDLYHTQDLPMLGELTLCQWNATKNFVPASFDDYVRKSLFE